VGIEANNRNEVLSRIVADLFVKSEGGEELSSKIHRLRDEIKKVFESEDTIYGRFRELVESFRQIIPEEKQRYIAAIKALSTTSKLSQQDIVKAVSSQLEELRIIEKGLLPALPAWRDELKVMEARSQEMRNEIAKLREIIARIESEEQGLLGAMAARKKELELAERSVGELFTVIAAEISHIKSKVEEFTAEPAAPQPIPVAPAAPAPVQTPVRTEERGGGGQQSGIPEPAAPQNSEWQKKCPMCGGRMDFYIKEDRWQCYSCAYEEIKEEVQPASEKNRELTDEPEPSPPYVVPVVDPAFNEYKEPKKESSPTKKKPCPACHKKMDWYPMENAWRCSFCDYERRI